MGTIVHTYEIPSAFERFDANAHQADCYANQRDMQTMRRNNNILLARRIRRSILSAYIKDENDAPVTFSSIQPPTLVGASYALSIPIIVSHLTQSLEINMRAKRSGSTDAVNAYWNCHTFDSSRPIDVANVMSVNTGTETKFNLTLPIDTAFGNPSNGMVDGRWVMLLSCAVSGQMDGTDKEGAAPTVTNAGSDWVEITAPGSSYIGLAIYDVTDTEVEPRIVVRVNTGVTRFWVDRPWNKIPANGDSMNFQAVSILDVYSLSVYENAVTDFNAQAGDL